MWSSPVKIAVKCVKSRKCDVKKEILMKQHFILVARLQVPRYCNSSFCGKRVPGSLEVVEATWSGPSACRSER